jgi:hypothetical protein
MNLEGSDAAMPNADASSIQVPIVHMAPNGACIDPTSASAQQFCQAALCIRLGFFYLQSLTPGTDFHCSSELALIDTGADGMFADYSLIEEHACPIAIGGETMRVNNEPGHTAHTASLFILQSKRVINLWVQGRDFVRENRPFKIVLDCRFLQSADWYMTGLPNALR